MGKITRPELLTSKHNTDDFFSTNTTLDDWLKKRALKNQKSGASKAFVVCEHAQAVIGYYALATGSIERNKAPGNFSRGMPEPIPVIILARLAVNKAHQNQHLGAALLKDAILRALSVADNVGIRGLLVHAISEEAKKFYSRYGFQESPIDPMTLMISIETLKKHF